MKTLFIKGVSLEYRVITYTLLSVCIMFADNHFDYLDRVRYSMAYASSPVYWVAHIPARVSFWMGDVFVSRSNLIEENSNLREQLLIAQRQLQLQASLTSENNRLRALNASARIVPGRTLTAEIINESTDPTSRRVLIDKGARDGVFENQAMVDAFGLMGQVDEVMPFTSWVLLITDSRSSTPVQVNRNGERAIARGSRTNIAELELEHKTATFDIKVGDLLVSSGMGERYPEDYPVAKVTYINHDPGQPFAIIKAKPEAKFESARYVLLIYEEEAVGSSQDTAPGASVLESEPGQENSDSAGSAPTLTRQEQQMISLQTDQR